MPATRRELREILTLARQAFPEKGEGRRFLKTEWNGVVAANVSQARIKDVCPIEMIHGEDGGFEKVKCYLQGRIDRTKTPGFDPLL